MSKATIVNLGTIVDTLKLNATFDNSAYEIKPEYQSSKIEDEVIEFNKTVDKLIELKKQAMEVKNHDAQMRFKLAKVDGIEYRVMASASASYSVILQNGDISIFLRKFSKKIKNPIVKVEFRAEYLARLGYIKCVQQVERLIQSVFIENPIYKVKEIHLATDIQGYEFTLLDTFRIKTLSRNCQIFDESDRNSFLSNRKFTGMSFGKGDLMLRIYNKTIEITKNKKKGFIQSLKWEHNPLFNPDLNVWRVEGQIRRDKLKELALEYQTTKKDGTIEKEYLNLDSLKSVLDAIPSIWNFFVSRYVHKDLTNNQIFEQIQGFKTLKNGLPKIITADTVKKRFQDANISDVWDAISTYNGHQGTELHKFEDIKKPEVEYVENAYKALMSTHTKLMRGNFSTSSLIDVIHNANSKYFDKNGHSILEKCRHNALDYLSSAKFYHQKYGFAFDGFDAYEKDITANLKEMIDTSVFFDVYKF